MRAVIGQFSGPYSPARTAKIYFVVVVVVALIYCYVIYIAKFSQLI